MAYPWCARLLSDPVSGNREIGDGHGNILWTDWINYPGNIDKVNYIRVLLVLEDRGKNLHDRCFHRIRRPTALGVGPSRRDRTRGQASRATRVGTDCDF